MVLLDLLRSTGVEFNLLRSTGLASEVEVNVILLSLLVTMSSGECLRLGVLGSLFS